MELGEKAIGCDNAYFARSIWRWKRIQPPKRCGFFIPRRWIVFTVTLELYCCSDFIGSFANYLLDICHRHYAVMRLMRFSRQSCKTELLDKHFNDMIQLVGLMMTI